MDLILAIVRWENRQLSGVIFLSGLIFLGSCVLYPLHYVLTTMGLYVLMTTLAAKLYVHLMGYLKKPCKDILASLDVYEIDDAEIESFVKRSSDKLLFVLVKVRSLLFVHDFETSAKFCFLLYILSHLGENTISVFCVRFYIVFKNKMQNNILKYLTNFYDKLSTFIFSFT